MKNEKYAKAVVEALEAKGRTDVKKSVAGDVINEFLELIKGGLVKGEVVQIPGFGTFKRKTRAARIGTNIRTKERIGIPAKVVPAFSFAKAVKDAVATVIVKGDDEVLAEAPKA